ncbi:restriction endonuclease subunit S [Glutamicibacter arilaitensis]|uniref:restriction endonuclease subunit S n=2 Tax=Glutamicibacter arilaitensis TaxID=256701 RepID=UPI003FCFE16B
MSQIDELIAEHCPNGVQHVAIGDIARTVAGLSGKTKSDFTDGNSRFASYKNIFANPSLNLVSEDFVKVGPGEKQNALRRGDVLITGSSESVEEVGMSAVVTSEPTEPIYVNSFCFIVRFDDPTMFDPDFAKHLFRSLNIRKQIQKCASGVTRINISKPRFLKVMIPVPPLEVQREIVRILDTFSKMEAELEAELEARKQQYEHYKSDVFRTTSDAQRVRLGEVADILQGFSFKSSSYVESGIRVVRISDVQKGAMSGKDLKYYSISKESEIKRYMLLPGDLVMSLSGSVGRVAMLTAMDVPAALNQRVACIRPSSSKILTRYLFHYLNTDEFEQRAISSTGNGTVKNISSKWLKDEFVPLPSMETQNRIIDILDKFDALVNDLSVGLPAELAARRQQYEYYRDKLLTFKELEPVS